MAADAAAPLSPQEIRLLGEVAGMMIPGDAALGMPAADDPAILADLARSLGRDLPLVREALSALARVERDRPGAPAPPAARDAFINAWYASGGAPAAALGRVLLAAYYRDDRVLEALGHEARAPFPKGYQVEQGDWSLLEAVRRRDAFWRDDRTGRGER
jgi:hypothetical protein